MADKWPLGNGVWSNAANWNDGTKPVPGDDVYADNRTVTIDEDVTVATVRTTQRSGGTAGGSFTLNDGITLTANVIAGTGTCIVFTAVSPASAFIIGNITGGPAIAVNNASSGTITITGDVVGGTANQAVGVINNSNGTTNIIGNVTGGSAGGSADGARNTSGQFFIVGNVTGGTGGSNNPGFSHNGTGTTTITGNVTGSAAFQGLRNISSGTVNIIGNVTGGIAGSSFGVDNTSTGTINITGSATAGLGSGIHGAVNTSVGTLRVTRVVGNGFGNGSIGLGPAYGISNSQNGIAEVEEIEYGDLGMSPTAGPISFKDLTTNVCLAYRVGLSKKTLVDPATAGDYPANGNVRSGTTFNFGNSTGTLAVPNPNQVAVGVATDNTVGTAVITEASLLPFLAQTLAPNAPIAVQRTIDDTKAITFSWPVSGATITGEKSIDNGSYSAVAGAIAFLRTESGRHYYTLAYNAADRLSVEGTVRYKMTDGTYTKYFNLHLYDVTAEVSVYPTQLQQEDRNVEGPIKIYTGETGQQFFFVLDSNLQPVDLTGKNLELRFADSGAKKTLYTAKTSNATISVSLTNKVTFTKSVDFTRFEMSTLRFSLRDIGAGGEVILTGPVKLIWAP